MNLYCPGKFLDVVHLSELNVEEATGGISKADFRNKLSVAYKEGRETHYWLRLLHRTQLLEDRFFNSLERDCTEILKMLHTILKNSKPINS